jgi:cytochrome c oxidase cbb3-type subunit 3
MRLRLINDERSAARRAPWAAAAMRGAMAAGLLAAWTSCKREARQFHVDAPSAEMAQKIVTGTNLNAGGSPATLPHIKNPYEENAYAMSEGKRLYQQFNCVGCHANGGGDKGPALMDDKWIYGSAPEQIHETIVEGRPNGMPSFRNKIPDYEVWQIAAYVRSMSGLASSNAAPARDDHMQYKQPENSVPTTQPKTTGVPSSGEMPQ